MSHPHPYYDYKVGDQVAITTLAGPCIAFDEGLADFIHLVRTTTDKDLVITIPPKARLTPAFDRLVDATGCIVLVRESSGGYRDLRTGRWTPEIRPAASNRDDPRIVVSEAHFQQDDLTPLLTVSASIYHRARLSTVLGRVAELICAHFMPEGTVLSWARTEPAGAVWDRKTFTKTARDNTPEAHMILAAHGPGRSVASGSMTINRTENGLEEYLEMTVLPTHIEPTWWQDRVNTFLQAVGTELKPQFALVLRTAGNDDGTFPPDCPYGPHSDGRPHRGARYPSVADRSRGRCRQAQGLGHRTRPSPRRPHPARLRPGARLGRDVQPAQHTRRRQRQSRPRARAQDKCGSGRRALIPFRPQEPGLTWHEAQMRPFSTPPVSGGADS